MVKSRLGGLDIQHIGFLSRISDAVFIAVWSLIQVPNLDIPDTYLRVAKGKWMLKC
jgi:hypothetical protein